MRKSVTRGLRTHTEGAWQWDSVWGCAPISGPPSSCLHEEGFSPHPSCVFQALISELVPCSAANNLEVWAAWLSLGHRTNGGDVQKMCSGRI